MNNSFQHDDDEFPDDEDFFSSLDDEEDDESAITIGKGERSSVVVNRQVADVSNYMFGNDEVRKKIILDFEKLKIKGVLTPDVGRGPMAEEYRIIKRPLLLNATGQGPHRVTNGNMIMVTSALPKEGKTFTAINLAMSLASEMDNSVILVDGDVAKPSVARIMEFKAKEGLTDYLMGNVEKLADVLIRTNIPKLMLLPAGRRHQHATELLASENMRLLLQDLANCGPNRIIVFDSPPLLMTTEARELARHMGQIIMVIEAENTPRMAVREALSQIENPEIVGVVLNKIRPRSGGGYGYGYGYGGYGGYGTYGGYQSYGNYGNYGNSSSEHPNNKRSFWKRFLGI